MDQLKPLAVTVPDAARLMDVAESTAWKFIADGTLPSFKLGKSRRIAVAALEQWMREQAEQSVTQEQGISAA